MYPLRELREARGFGVIILLRIADVEQSRAVLVQIFRVVALSVAHIQRLPHSSSLRLRNRRSGSERWTLGPVAERVASTPV
jgi:hypothetical protein